MRPQILNISPTLKSQHTFIWNIYFFLNLLKKILSLLDESLRQFFKLRIIIIFAYKSKRFYFSVLEVN